MNDLYDPDVQYRYIIQLLERIDRKMGKLIKLLTPVVPPPPKPKLEAGYYQNVETCYGCGQEFLAGRGTGRRINARYHSDECRKAHRKPQDSDGRTIRAPGLKEPPL